MSCATDEASGARHGGGGATCVADSAVVATLTGGSLVPLAVRRGRATKERKRDIAIGAGGNCVWSMMRSSPCSWSSSPAYCQDSCRTLRCDVGRGPFQSAMARGRGFCAHQIISRRRPRPNADHLDEGTGRPKVGGGVKYFWHHWAEWVWHVHARGRAGRVLRSRQLRRGVITP